MTLAGNAVSQVALRLDIKSPTLMRRVFRRIGTGKSIRSKIAGLVLEVNRPWAKTERAMFRRDQDPVREGANYVAYP